MGVSTVRENTTVDAVDFLKSSDKSAMRKAAGLRQIFFRIVFIAILGAVGAIFTTTVVRYLGFQRAVWLRLEANTSQQALPAVRVTYNAETSKKLPVIWKRTEGRTIVGFELRPPQRAVRLIGIQTESGPLPLDDVKIVSKWEHLSNPTAYLVTGPGLIILSGDHTAVTPIFQASADSGTVLIHWLDEEILVDLSAQSAGPHHVPLITPENVHSGWVLLPPESIERLELDVPSGFDFTLRHVKVFSDEEQEWAAGSQVAWPLTGDGCRATPVVDGLLIRGDSSNACALSFRSLKEINHVPLTIRVLLWSALILAGLASFWCASYIASQARGWEMRYEVAESRIGHWLCKHTQSWSLSRLVLVVGAVSFTYHLAYALFTPMLFSPDSTGYYAWAREFFNTHSLDSINPYRTPGYPIIYALTIWLFGDQVQALILLQHLALALLGPLTVWFLYPRFGAAFSAVGGLLVGFCPMVSIAANVVWTESLFAASSYAALLGFLWLKSRGGWRLLFAGSVVGIATLIRPNGILLLVVMLGWIFLEWLLQPDRARLFWKKALEIVWLTLGCVIVLSPWLYHIRSHTGQWDLTSVAAAATEGGQGNTNTPEHATYINTMWQSPSLELWEITRPYHSIIHSLPENPNHRLDNVAYRQDLAYGLIHYSLIWDKRFPTELFREYVRRYSRDYFRVFSEALIFNIFHALPTNSPFFVYEELGYPSYHLTRPYPIPQPPAVDSQALLSSPVTPEKVGPVLEQMIHRWEPSRSHVRTALLWSSRFVVAWGWMPVAVLALAGFLASLLLAPLREFAVLGLFWLGNAAASASGLAGADRYMVVCEPLMYILTLTLIYIAIVLRLEKHAAQA